MSTLQNELRKMYTDAAARQQQLSGSAGGEFRQLTVEELKDTDGKFRGFKVTNTFRGAQTAELSITQGNESGLNVSLQVDRGVAPRTSANMGDVRELDGIRTVAEKFLTANSPSDIPPTIAEENLPIAVAAMNKKALENSSAEDIETQW